MDVSDGSGMTTLSTTTDAQGRFHLKGVLFEQDYFKPDNSINFIIVKTGYDGAETKKLSFPEIKKAGEGDFGKVVLTPGQTLRGRVIDGNGNPLHGVVWTRSPSPIPTPELTVRPATARQRFRQRTGTARR